MEIKTTYDRLIDLIIKEKEKENLTLKYLADLTGCSANQISKCLYSKKIMNADVMFALLQALGFRIELHRKKVIK